MSTPNNYDPRYQYDPNRFDGVSDRSQTDATHVSRPGTSSENTSHQAPQYNDYTAYHTANSSQPPSFAQSMGYTQNAPHEKPVVPKTLRTAAYLMYAVTALSLLGSILQTIFMPDLQNQMMQAFGMDAQSMNELNQQNSSQFGVMRSVMGIGSAIVMSALYVMFTIFALKGHNWARIVMTVIFALHIFGLLGVIGMAALGIFHPIFWVDVLVSLLSIAGIVYLWLKPSNDFFRATKAYKQWQMYSRYN
ncbi:hypothetical protein VVR12_08225 [Rothia sp. LK2588]|uniref:hypothetical protein n=1 Tax=Rothia sp. LK2588 TaxID=3114369 RepID=UPI0034CE9BAD